MKNNKVQYLPIRARSKDESEVLDLYLVNICNIVDALDLEIRNIVFMKLMKMKNDFCSKICYKGKYD